MRDACTHAPHACLRGRLGDEPIAAALEPDLKLSGARHLHLVRVQGHPDPHGTEGGLDGLFYALARELEAPLRDNLRVLAEAGAADPEAFGPDRTAADLHHE